MQVLGLHQQINTNEFWYRILNNYCECADMNILWMYIFVVVLSSELFSRLETGGRTLY